jgi:hypothetical protein
LPQFLNIQLLKVVLLLDDAVKSEENQDFEQLKATFSKLCQEILKLKQYEFQDHFQDLFNSIGYSISKAEVYFDYVPKLYSEDLNKDLVPEQLKLIKTLFAEISVENPKQITQVFEPNHALYFRLFFLESWKEFRKNIYTTNTISKNKSLGAIYNVWKEVEDIFAFLYYATLSTSVNSERLVFENGTVFVGSAYKNKSENVTFLQDQYIENESKSANFSQNNTNKSKSGTASQDQNKTENTNFNQNKNNKNESKSATVLQTQNIKSDTESGRNSMANQPVVLIDKCYTGKEIKISKEIPTEAFEQYSDKALSFSKDLMSAFEKKNYCQTLESLQTMEDRAKSILTQLKIAAIGEQIATDLVKSKMSCDPIRREAKIIETFSENIKIRDLMAPMVFGCSKNPQTCVWQNQEMMEKYCSIAMPSYTDDFCLELETNQNHKNCEF